MKREKQQKEFEERMRAAEKHQHQQAVDQKDATLRAMEEVRHRVQIEKAHAERSCQEASAALDHEHQRHQREKEDNHNQFAALQRNLKANNAEVNHYSGQGVQYESHLQKVKNERDFMAAEGQAC